VLASLGSALLHVATGVGVTTVPQAFVAAIARSLCEALSDCVLGLVLIDVVANDKAAAARLQASTTAARVFGSFLAYLAGLWLYGCGYSPAVDGRAIIAGTGVLPLAAALLACWLPDKAPESTQRAYEDDGVPAASPIVLFKMVAGLCLFEFCVVWASVQPMVDAAVWASVLAIACLTSLGLVLRGYMVHPAQRAAIAAAGFLFLLNASPSADDAWFSFSYSMLAHSQCSAQYLAIVGEVASLLACGAFDRLQLRFPARLRAELSLVVFVLLSCAVSGANAAIVQSRGGDNPLAAFAALGFFTSFVSRLAFLAQQTFATERCFAAKTLTPGVMYGVYLSLLDFGDSASAWLSAPLIAAFNIDYLTDNWSGLVPLIVISVCLQIFIIGASAPLLLMGRDASTAPGYERVEVA